MGVRLLMLTGQLVRPKLMRLYKWAWLLFIPSFLFGEQTKTVFNPFTGKPDYITVLSSSSLAPGSTQYIQNTFTPTTTTQVYNVMAGTVTDTFQVGASTAANAFTWIGGTSTWYTSGTGTDGAKIMELDNNNNGRLSLFASGPHSQSLYLEARAASGYPTITGNSDRFIFLPGATSCEWIGSTAQDRFYWRSGQKFSFQPQSITTYTFTTDNVGSTFQAEHPSDNILMTKGYIDQTAPAYLHKGDSSTSEREMFSITPTWADSTDATRKASVSLNIWDTTSRTYMQTDTDGISPYTQVFGSMTFISTIAVRGAIDAGGYGTSGQFLTSNGDNAAPSWTTAAGGGGGTTIWGQDEEAVVSNAVSTVTTEGVVQSSLTASGKYAIFLNYDKGPFTDNAGVFSAKSSSITLLGPTIALGVNTSGNYVSSVTGTSGITITGTNNTPSAAPIIGVNFSSIPSRSDVILNQNSLQAGSTAYPAFIYNGSSGTLVNILFNGTQTFRGAIFSSGTTNGLYNIAAYPNNNYPVNDQDAGGIYLDNTRNSGIGMNIYSNQASAAGLGVLLRIHADNTSFAQPLVHLIQDGTNGAAANIRMDGPAPQIELVESDQVAPAGKYEWGVNGDLMYYAGRNAADSAFENFVQFGRKAAAGGGYFGVLSTNTFRQYDGDSSNYVAMRSSGDVTTSWNMILPSTWATVGKVLSISAIDQTINPPDIYTDWVASGSGSPGGSDTQFQYNNGGSFGGTSSFNYYPSSNSVTISSAVSITNVSSFTFSQGSSNLTLSGTNATFTGYGINLDPELKTANYVITATDTVVLSSGGLNARLIFTLPSLNGINNGQQIKVMKVDMSTQPVTILAASGDTIMVTTTQVKLWAPGASITLNGHSAGRTWSSDNFTPYPPRIGENAFGTAVALTANRAVCSSFFVPVPVAARGLAFNVTTTSNTGKTDVGIYDYAGKKMGSSGSQAGYQTSANQKILNFMVGGSTTPAYLAPGPYVKCIVVDNAIVTLDEVGTKVALGVNTFTTSMPLPATLALPGTIATTEFEVGVVLYNGDTQ